MPVRQIRHYGELYLQGKIKDTQRKVLLETHRDTIIDEIKNKSST